MRSWARRSPVSAGIVLVVVGVVSLFLAWNGAAGLDHVEGQVPYLISGGLLGLGLIGAGLTVVNVQTRREDNAAVLAKLEDLAEALQHAPAAGVPTLTAVPARDAVVAGRSTYHLPSCRIVAGKHDMQPMSAADAAARGLTRCRICKPPAVAS